MTEWHGSSSILSSLLSSPYRANTLYPQAHRFLYVYASLYTCGRVYDHVYLLRTTANLFPFECKVWIFPAALFAGINSPYFERDIRLLTDEWFSQANQQSLVSLISCCFCLIDGIRRSFTNIMAHLPRRLSIQQCSSFCYYVPNILPSVAWRSSHFLIKLVN